MNADGDELGQGPDAGTDEGVTPPPPDQPGSSSGGDPAKRLEQLEQENAQYRKQIRETQAEKLVAEHSLPKGLTSLLAGLDKDKQEAKAKELAEEMKTASGAAPTDPKPEGEGTPPAKPAAEEPAGVDQLKGAGGDPQGEPKVPEPEGRDADFLKQLDGTKDEKELMAIVQRRQDEETQARQAAFERDAAAEQG